MPDPPTDYAALLKTVRADLPRRVVERPGKNPDVRELFSVPSPGPALDALDALAVALASLQADLDEAREDRDGAFKAGVEAGLYAFGEPRDVALAEAVEARAQAEERAEQAEAALREAGNELGVPGPDYPAPVANAANIIRAALAASEAETERGADCGPAGRKAALPSAIREDAGTPRSVSAAKPCLTCDGSHPSSCPECGPWVYDASGLSASGETEGEK